MHGRRPRTHSLSCLRVQKGAEGFICERVTEYFNSSVNVTSGWKEAGITKQAILNGKKTISKWVGGAKDRQSVRTRAGQIRLQPAKYNTTQHTHKHTPIHQASPDQLKF